eukprot:COSAG01_NODE_4917_length_4624_cov_13.942320_1_plen_542_part_00
MLYITLVGLLLPATTAPQPQQQVCAMHQLPGKACTNLRIVRSLGTIRSASVDACCASCAALPACGAWTFHGTAKQSCTLADRVSHPGTVAGATCGSRQPPGPGPSPSPSPSDNNITVGEFTQAIDHFGTTPGTFQQKYAFWSGAWKGPGHPIFLSMPEEAGLNPSRLTRRNTMYDVAVQDYGALIVGIEHRFYGRSQPYGSSPTSAQLGLLTVEQSLEDVAAIQRHITAQLGANTSQWVLWGASYPGCLAAWYRVKYPAMSSGAVASSTIVTTPLFATSPMGYTATHVLGQECTAAYTAVSRTLDSMVETAAGRATLISDFAGYDSAVALSADDTTWYDFMSDMAAFIESAAGYNYPIILQYPWISPTFHMCSVMEGAHSCDLALEAVCGVPSGGAGSPTCDVCVGKQQHHLRAAGCTSGNVANYCAGTGSSATMDAFVDLTTATCNFRRSRGRACSGNVLPKRFFWQMCTQLSWAGSLYDSATGFFSPRITAQAFVAHCHRQFPGVVDPAGFNSSWILSYATASDFAASSNLIISGGGCE